MSTEAVRTNKQIIERVEEVLQAAYSEHPEFNSAMDAGGPIDVPSLNPSVGTYKLLPSDAIFWADRKAYFEDELLWRNSSLEDTHREAVDQLKSAGLVPPFHDLVNAIRRNRVAPFIGAGMSLPSKFPLWGAALQVMAAKVPSVDRAAFDAAITNYDYLGAAQLLWDEDDVTVRNEIRTVFAKSLVPPPPLPGPIRLLPRFSKACVITTNFDSVIEIVLKDETLDGYMHGVQAENNFVAKLIKGERCIMKLHGDAENPASYIYTSAQYTAGYGDPFDFKKPLPRALRQIFVSHSLLFLGCSLEQDKTMDLFKAVKDQQEFSVPDHYAILEDPADPAVKAAKQSRLLTLEIRPLWYPNGKHEFVESYLQLAIDAAEGRYKI